MNPAPLIALAGAGVTFLVALLTAAVGYGLTKGKVEAIDRTVEAHKADSERDMADIRQRLAAAEAANAGIQTLAHSIESMGDKFGLEIKHLVESFEIQNTYIRDQLSELKNDMRQARDREMST